ncbi:ras-related protein Rab-34-like [Anneissia japonica]|uniref:ras-related protein Rab-34-like n=1 Tax=Anneissia japonica TaxID=1529436 RepID=UPI0014259D11|nr:ras-related protein Rab-34-like [Anneissia japonica]
MNSLSRTPRERSIICFPACYLDIATPYKQNEFSSKVRTACLSNKTGTVGLKVSKAIVIGDVAVGKTCLVNRFCHQVFDRDYKATIGVDFEVERFDILNVPFNLQIWDTAGQERFKCIAAAYYRGAHVVIIVFDMSDPYTLQHAKKWYDEAKNECRPDAHIFLVGTKKDLCADHQLHELEGLATKLATDIAAEYWAVSSLTGENVTDFFERVAAMSFDHSVCKELDDIDSRMVGKRIGGGSNLLSNSKSEKTITLSGSPSSLKKEEKHKGDCC